MEHAKKMLIVPVEEFQRTLSAQQNSTNTTVSQLDSEMLKLLNNKTLSDKDKWDQYQQVLQRFLHFATQNRKPVSIPIIDTGDQNGVDIESIVNTFSKTYKHDAKNLLSAIVRRSDLISWDSNGAITIRGTYIPNSNIIDVIHDVVRMRKPVHPPGWSELMDVFLEMNIPSEFVTNPISRQYLAKLKTGSQSALSSSQEATPVKSSQLDSASNASPLNITIPRKKDIAKKLYSKWEDFKL